MVTKIFLVVAIILFVPLMSISAEEPENEILLHEPFLVTSAGQSLDAYLVKAAFDKLGVKSDLETIAYADDLEGFNQIIIVGGFSHKGIASAGLSFLDEIERVSQILEKAEEISMPIIFIYLGTFFLGDSREVNLIEVITPLASQIIVYVECSGPLSYIYEVAEKNDIPVSHINDVNDLSEEFSRIFLF